MRIVVTDPFPKAPAEIPAGLTVITPNRGAAMLLRSPHRPLDSIAKDVLKGQGLRVLPKLRSRYYQKRAIKEVLGWKDPDGDVLSGQDAAAYLARINEALTTVLRLRIDDEALTKHGGTGTKQLAEVVRLYRAFLSREQLVDSEAILIEASNCVMFQRPILVWGYFRAREEEIRFIDAIAGDGSIFYLPCGDDPIFQKNREWAAKLEKYGWTLRREGSSGRGGAGAELAAKFTGIETSAVAEAVSYPNVEAEVRGVLTRCKRLLVNGTPLHRIGIIARKPENYAASFAAVAAEYGIPLQIARQVPTLHTAFGGFMQLLLDAIENGLPFEETVRLLMHRFGPGLDAEKLAEARKEHFSGREAWSAAGLDAAIFDLPEMASILEWFEQIERILDGLGAAERINHDAAALIAYQNFCEEVRSVGLIEKAGFMRPSIAKMPFAAFRSLCLEALYETKAPFSAAKAGIELLGTDALFGAEYDHLFFVGLAEGEFPAHVVDNAAVDFYERERLAEHGIEFESADEVGRWESLAFYLSLLSARQSVTLSYARIGKKDELPESPFFQRLGLTPSEETQKAAVCSNIEALRLAVANDQSAIGQAAARRLRAELSRETSAHYDEYDGIAGIPFDPAGHNWSVSQITHFGQCSFKWYAEKLLRLEEPEEKELSLDVSKRGTFYHRVLELATLKALDSADQKSAILAALEEAFAEAEKDPEVELPAYTNWPLQADEHLKIIRKAVEAKDFIDSGDRIIAAEKKFCTEWEGLTIRGTIDRIDETGENEKLVIAIDYKTSSLPPKGAKNADGEPKLDVQVPVYAEVALRALYPEKNVGRSRYYSLTKGKNLRATSDRSLDDVRWLIGRLKSRLRAGAFPVDPDRRNEVCTHCKFDTVCRKSRRLNRKEYAE
jgi:RecB family exonuclease